jgi:hypothetical protein
VELLGAKIDAAFEKDPLGFLEWALKIEKLLAPAPAKTSSGTTATPPGGGRAAGVDLTLTEEPAPAGTKPTRRPKARK